MGNNRLIAKIGNATRLLIANSVASSTANAISATASAASATDSASSAINSATSAINSAASATASTTAANLSAVSAAASAITLEKRSSIMTRALNPANVPASNEKSSLA